MPPVLHVALDELARGAAQQLGAVQRRVGVDQRHRVLQLVAEPVGAAGLVEAAAAPHPARDHLVQQPSVGQQIDGLLRRLDLDGAERALPVVPDLLERVVGRAGAAEAVHQVARVVEVLSRAQHERDLALLAVGELDRGLHREAGIERGADLTGQGASTQRRRLGQAAVAAEERGAIAGDRALPLAAVEEGDPCRELRVVGVAGQQRARAGVELGDDVGRVGGAAGAQHQLDVAGEREHPPPARPVAQLDHDELHRRVGRDERGERARDAGLGGARRRCSRSRGAWCSGRQRARGRGSGVGDQ